MQLYSLGIAFQEGLCACVQTVEMTVAYVAAAACALALLAAASFHMPGAAQHRPRAVRPQPLQPQASMDSYGGSLTY